MIQTKVCIIGSGPAGAATSLMLAKKKIAHYIIDKETFPRDKTCGDGLILYAYKALKTIDEDLFQNFLEHPKIMHSANIKLHVSPKATITFKETKKDRPQVISYAKRYDFDDFLVQHLSPSYAQKEFGNPVKIIKEKESGIYIKLKDGKEILADLVIGADGANSVVSKKLSPHKANPSKSSTFITAYFKGVRHLPTDNTAEIRLVYKKVLFFFYIFPLSSGEVNVSLGATTKNLKESGLNLIEELEHLLQTHPKIKHKFTEATRTSKWRGWTIPFHFGTQNAYGNRFMLVGDAAGLANAFYKEGVGTAMMSGIICAKKIEHCLQQNNFSSEFLRSYQHDLKKEFSKLLKFSRLALKLARHQKIFSFFTKVFKNRVESSAPKMIKKRSY